MRCIARCTSNPFKQCSFKLSNNSNFCKKHCYKRNIKQTIYENLFTINQINNFFYKYIKLSDINLKDNFIKKKYNISKIYITIL